MQNPGIPSRVTVGQNDRSGRPGRAHTKVWILAAAVVIVSVIAVFLFAHGDNEQPQKKPAVATGDNQLKPVEIVYEQLTAEQLINKVNLLTVTKQYAEAEKLIRMQNDLDTNTIKQSLLASILRQQGKTDEAVMVTEDLAAAGGLQPGQIRQIAEQYEKSGDKAKAIEYYQKAIAAYKARNIGADASEVARLEKKLQELQ